MIGGRSLIVLGSGADSVSLTGADTVVEEFVSGPSLSIEVVSLGGEAVTLGGKSLCPLLPIVRRRILMRGGHAADAHRISPIFSVPKV